MAKKPKKENFLLNLIFNIILPVIILERLGDTLTPLGALLLAVSLPVGYGLHDLIRNSHKNFISLLGLVNILLTGSFAFFRMHGLWFILKEALVPLLFGVAIAISSKFKEPFFKNIMMASGLFDKLDDRNLSLEQKKVLDKHWKNCNLIFALSFFISALLNAILAAWIFVPIDPSLHENMQQNILNQQVAKMTWMGYVFISVPLILFGLFVFWIFFKKLTKILDAPLSEILNTSK